MLTDSLGTAVRVTNGLLVSAFIADLMVRHRSARNKPLFTTWVLLWSTLLVQYIVIAFWRADPSGISSNYSTFAHGAVLRVCDLLSSCLLFTAAAYVCSGGPTESAAIRRWTLWGVPCI